MRPHATCTAAIQLLENHKGAHRMPSNNIGYCAYCGKWKQKKEINYNLRKAKCHACIEKVKQRNQQLKGENVS